jgi:hypothetical protein
LQNTTRQAPVLISRLIAEALDDDIFDISTANVNESDAGFPTLFILQDGPDEHRYTHQLVSLPQSRVVAIIERDADIGLAAKALVTARFSCGGKSPYAPDLILVNEWVKEKFLEAVMQECVATMAQDSDVASKRNIQDSLGSLQSQIKSGEARIVLSGSNGVVVDISKR